MGDASNTTGPFEAQSFAHKAPARTQVWDHLQDARLARFPFPPHGRIPNFKGAKEAAERLFEHEPFRSARRLKVNPDAPQRYVRLLALQRGITVFLPTPRLRAGFMRLDPARIPPESLTEAASLSKCKRYAEMVPLRELPTLDGIVTGSVAVTASGARCGKGEGYGDLELAILAELGHPPLPIATTVHDHQLVGSLPIDPTDLGLSLIVTPTRSLTTPNTVVRSPGIQWHLLSEERLDEMPILKELQPHP